jgi:23S rRNA pseudouridine2605 synthase
MALTLVDKVMRGTFKQQPATVAAEGGGKRKRAESGSFSGGGNPFLPSRRLNSMDSQPGFSRGGFRGGFRGGSSGGSRGGKSGFNDSRGGRRSSYSPGDKRYYKSGDRDRSSGGGSGGSSGRSGSGGSGYSNRY